MKYEFVQLSVIVSMRRKLLDTKEQNSAIRQDMAQVETSYSR